MLERPVTVAEVESPAWLVAVADLEEYWAKPRREEQNTSVETMALLAGDGPLMRDGEAVRVTVAPSPSGTSVSERTWVKLTVAHAEKSSHTEELPKLMRLWFAAVERCDSDGRADFDTGELAEILGCAERTMRDTIAQGKRCGQLREKSDARHVYLIGVTNDRPSAVRLTKKRRAEDVAKRPRR
ncbi:hypothetical protein CFK38_06225 [Brachybacterium vulturis]|uniref:Uncharacterized protein n=1 Tax=Brachybacterium vulturis TaxID=2017484 RepID=A0A291GLS2_9MICO|nr:hypothetical protein CFK38_06225 [Brachybacterium vulturis]